MRAKVLLFTCETWPMAALFADSLVGAGLEVGALSPSTHPLRSVSSVIFQRDYQHPLRHALLAKAIGDMQPSLIIPCDDTAVAVLHEHHAACGADPAARARKALIEQSLGDPAHFEILRKKSDFIAFAKAQGVQVPTTLAIEDSADLAEKLRQGSWPKVLKADGWSGGRGTHVVRSPDEAQAAYAEIARARGMAAMVKDSLRAGSLMPLYRTRIAPDANVTLQTFVPGRPVNRAVICWRGKVIAGRTFEAVRTMPNNGNATVVRLRDIPAVDQAVELLVERLGISGVAGFDFMHDDDTGATHLLEVNPRATTACYAAPKDMAPLAHAFAALFPSLASRRAPAAAVRAPRTLIALFPQEIERDPESAYLVDGDHTVPWHEPALVEACLRQATQVTPYEHFTRLVKRVLSSEPVAVPARRAPLDWMDGALGRR